MRDLAARLGTALDQLEHDPGPALDALAPVLDVLAGADREDPPRVAALTRGLEDALGVSLTAVLVDGARTPAEISERFARLARLHAARAAASAPRIDPAGTPNDVVAASSQHPPRRART